MFALAAVFPCWAPLRVSAQDEAELPAPVGLALETKDGVQLQSTVYPAPHEGKDTTPVILLHGLKKTRHTMVDLAEALQEAGCTVLALDLRGHGDSTEVKGMTKRLDAEKLNRGQLEGMAGPGGDLERAKGALLDLHNEGKLNIEKLCVVGVDFSCLTALNWSRLDWDYPVLATGKQGQDVAAVVLISPRYTYKSLKMDAAINHPYLSKQMPIYITAGVQTPKAKEDAEKLHKAFQRHREKQDDIEKPEERTLFYIRVDSSLQSDEMLNEPSLEVVEKIVKFVNLKVSERTVPWKERKNPLK